MLSLFWKIKIIILKRSEEKIKIEDVAKNQELLINKSNFSIFQYRIRFINKFLSEGKYLPVYSETFCCDYLQIIYPTVF